MTTEAQIQSFRITHKGKASTIYFTTFEQGVELMRCFNDREQWRRWKGVRHSNEMADRSNWLAHAGYLGPDGVWILSPTKFAEYQERFSSTEKEPQCQ